MRNAGRAYAAKITPATYAYYFNAGWGGQSSDALQPQVNIACQTVCKVRAFHHF